MRNEPSELFLKFRDFEEKFPDDETCARFLLENGWRVGKRCKYCDSTEFSETIDFKTHQCLQCGKSNRVFEGTILVRVQLVRPWFAGIWFLSSGILYSRKEFSELFGIALDTAQRISNTISLHLTKKMEGFPTVPSASFSKIFERRSSETPARKPPIAEQYELEKQSRSLEGRSFGNGPLDGSDSSEVIELSEGERTVLEMLDFENWSSVNELADKIDFDFSFILTIIAMLEIKGFVVKNPEHLLKRSLVRKELAASNGEELGLVVDDFLKKGKAVWHGISRKNVQLHVALYWSTTRLDIWEGGHLMFEILDCEPLSKGTLRSYVSPLNIQVPFAA